MTNRAKCSLTDPHDCANVRAANSALQRHLNRACDDRDQLRAMAAAVIAEIEKRDGEGNVIPAYLYAALKSKVTP